jgi:hypothetical protein
MYKVFVNDKPFFLTNEIVKETVDNIINNNNNNLNDNNLNDLNLSNEINILLSNKINENKINDNDINKDTHKDTNNDNILTNCKYSLTSISNYFDNNINTKEKLLTDLYKNINTINNKTIDTFKLFYNEGILINSN